MHLQAVRIAASIFRQLDTEIEGTLRAWNLRFANSRRRTSLTHFRLEATTRRNAP